MNLCMIEAHERLFQERNNSWMKSHPHQTETLRKRKIGRLIMWILRWLRHGVTGNVRSNHDTDSDCIVSIWNEDLVINWTSMSFEGRGWTCAPSHSVREIKTLWSSMILSASLISASAPVIQWYYTRCHWVANPELRHLEPLLGFRHQEEFI